MKVTKRFPQNHTGQVIRITCEREDVYIDLSNRQFASIAIIEPSGQISGHIVVENLARLGNGNWAIKSTPDAA